MFIFGSLLLYVRVSLLIKFDGDVYEWMPSFQLYFTGAHDSIERNNI